MFSDMSGMAETSSGGVGAWVAAAERGGQVAASVRARLAALDL